MCALIFKVSAWTRSGHKGHCGVTLDASEKDEIGTCLVPGQGLWCHRVPSLQVHDDTLIEAAPQAVPLRPVLQQLGLQAKRTCYSAARHSLVPLQARNEIKAKIPLEVDISILIADLILHGWKMPVI